MNIAAYLMNLAIECDKLKAALAADAKNYALFLELEAATEHYLDEKSKYK